VRGEHMKSSYPLLSGVIFGLVALLQAARAIADWAVQIGPFSVPVWLSWVVAIVAGSLAIWAFRTRWMMPR
jgi:hypothetical protein